MIAKIVVDVPSGQTDRLFDYSVPHKLIGIIEKGMRVVVPFGPRQVQGFVVELGENTEVTKLKPISEILELTPALTEELLQLGDWLTETTLSFKISAYQVMLPAAMRSKVKKNIHLLTDFSNLSNSLQKLFHNRDVISWDEVKNYDESLLKIVKSEITNGHLEINYFVKDKLSKKTEKQVKSLKSKAELLEIMDSITPRAEKQKKVLSFFLEHTKAISVNTLIKKSDVSRTTIKTLIDKGILSEEETELYRDPFMGKQFAQTEPLILTEKQKGVLKPIITSIEQNLHQTFLLHGVTGSGKTEIYLQSIEKVLKKGKEAIVLVPEISLTPQMVERFKGRFGSQVAVLHSALSMGEKYDEWRKIQRKEVKVVVGARSAVFAPFENLGIIIIDEEHEASYKQEESPRYHARDVAIFRGNYHHCPVVLGSATPSLESYARATKGVYVLLPLLSRVNNLKMPPVDIIDMREELRQGNRSMFSRVLFQKMQERIEKGEQSVLFLNRRGYSTFVMCRDCGYVALCSECDISLTYHRISHSLKCHYCGHEERMPATCHECNSEHIRFFGSGTQKVEEELLKVLPGVKVIRMDVDTTRKKGSHQKLLEQFEQGKADILLGTQMIAKGLDFPKITLVGVLAADTMLHLPDFRAAERTFQLLTQVSGRAGRHRLSGEVVVQTYSPEHYSIEFAQEHNFQGFFNEEMNVRKKGGYTPYYYLSLIGVSHPELTKVIHVTEKITSFIKREVAENVIVLGPVASPIPRIKNRYRYQCLIKYKNEPNLLNLLRDIQHHFVRETSQGDLQISIDMNPYTFM